MIPSGSPPDAPEAGPAEFAVLVPLIDHGGEQCILLTHRVATLPRYGGQVCFPGGGHDPGDVDLAATAIRETGEELGIEARRIDLLLELPEQRTGIGHRVQPFLARVAPGPVEPNPREVERVLYVPVSLLGRDPFLPRAWTAPDGRSYNTWTFEFEGLEVWGLTARILREHFVGKSRRTA